MNTIPLHTNSKTLLDYRDQYFYPIEEEGLTARRIAHEVWGVGFTAIRRRVGTGSFVYVLAGSGRYHTDTTTTKLSAGSLFYFGPQWSCWFDVPHEPMTVYIVVFGGEGEAELSASLGDWPRVLSLQNAPSVEGLFRFMYEAARSGEALQQTIIQNCLPVLVSTIASGMHPRVTQSSKPQRRFTEIRDFIRGNLRHIRSARELAETFDLTPEHLCRLFQRYSGSTPYAFLTHQRLNEASHLLTTTDLPVGQIAREVGIPDALSFSRTFKRETGLSPKNFRTRITKSSGVT